jgi:tetratricopeptide (TPR) repeat protein
MIRAVGVAITAVYAAAIVWAYASQPQTSAEAIGGLASTLGAYRVDEQSFGEAVELFRQDRFAEARASFERADPAHRDARSQFYVGYSFYREGWRRFYSDDALYKQGLEAVNRAIALAPGQQLAVDDPQLMMHTAEELRGELERGLRTDASDFNPMRAFAPRK